MEIHPEMEESKVIHSTVNQVAIQVATAVMMALRDTDVGSRSAANIASLREPQKQRHGGPAPEKFHLTRMPRTRM